MSAHRCLREAASKGFLAVTDALLDHVPELLDYRLISGVPEPGTNDCLPLLIACTSTNMPDDVRVQMVELLLGRFRSRAVQHGSPMIFSITGMGREFPHVASEFKALQAARLYGHAAVEFLLLAAGVPSELDPTMLALLARRGQPNEGLTNTMGDQNVFAAMRLFGGNSPMAWGYLVGSLGLEDRPPPDGWESCDPGGVKAKADQERMVVKAQMNEYRSRLLFAESERLREDLLRDQAELRRRDGAPVLLAFVCNPDRTLGKRLPQALNDALAASHAVAAKIFGGTYEAVGGTSEAAAEDRTCTFERLEAELSRQRYRIFLFSGHANLQDEERQKTLGFTGSDGKFAPIVDARKVAELLGCVRPPICQPHPARADRWECVLAYGSRRARDHGLELVVLNGCESLALGKMCREAGVPVVVCWETLVESEAAYLFARGFFGALGQDGRASDGYARAFKAGVEAILGKRRRVRAEDGSVADVPYFELRDPGVRVASSSSFAAGLPLLLPRDGGVAPDEEEDENEEAEEEE